MRMTTVEYSKDYLNFSAAHFTIFSATERERLHGHNFRVAAKCMAPVAASGLCFNYQIIKHILLDICRSLDELTLLPGLSPYLQIEDSDTHRIVIFNEQSMSLLKEDTCVLPISNATLEELAYYILRQLTNDHRVRDLDIRSVEIKVSSGAGVWCSSSEEFSTGA